jgi:hypothetical protein
MTDKPYITELGKGTNLGGCTEVHFPFKREEGFTEEVTFELKQFNFFVLAVDCKIHRLSPLMLPILRQLLE